MGSTVLLGMRVLLSAVLIGGLVGAILCHLHALEPELGTGPHGRKGLGKEVLVEGVAIVLPQVSAVPCIGNEVVGSPDTHTTKQTALGEDGPTLLHTSILFGSLLPILITSILDDIIEQRHM